MQGFSTKTGVRVLTLFEGECGFLISHVSRDELTEVFELICGGFEVGLLIECRLVGGPLFSAHLIKRPCGEGGIVGRVHRMRI